MKMKLNNSWIQLEKKTEMEFDEIDILLEKRLKDQILFLIFIKCYISEILNVGLALPLFICTNNTVE